MQASGSSPSTCSAFSTFISRRKRKAAASASRWFIVLFRCTTGTSRSSRRRERARHFTCCCRKRELIPARQEGGKAGRREWKAGRLECGRQGRKVKAHVSLPALNSRVSALHP